MDDLKVYKNIDEIPLLSKEEEKSITVSDETIQTFISCCQDEQCKICVKNIIELQYLSKKYDVPQLISITSKYLDDHWRKNALNSLLFKLQLSSNLDKSEIEEWNENYFDTQIEEEFIESNLEEFIDQEELLSLPISTLNKIFMKSIKTVQTDKAIEFLFKCLDRYGKDASILFNCVDFERQKIRVVDKLVHEYKEKFDFNLINSTLSETAIELTSELRRLKEEFNISLSEMKRLFNEQRDELIQMKIEEEKRNQEEEKKREEKEKFFQEKMKQMETETNNQKDIFSQEMEKQRTAFQHELNKMKSEMEKQKEIFNYEINLMKNEKKKADEIFVQEIEEQKEIVHYEIDQLKLEMKKQKDDYDKEIESQKIILQDSTEYAILELEKYEVEKQKEILHESTEHVKLEMEKQKDSYTNEIETFLTQQKGILQNETKRIINCIQNQKGTFQQEMDKQKDKFQQIINEVKQKRNEAVNLARIVDCQQISTSAVEPKYFSNLDDTLQTFLIKEIIEKFSMSQCNKYDGLIKKVLLLKALINSANSLMNENAQIKFIKNNILNVLIDSSMTENLYQKGLLISSIMELINDFDLVLNEVILSSSLFDKILYIVRKLNNSLSAKVKISLVISGQFPDNFRINESNLIYKYRVEPVIEETNNETFSNFKNLRFLELLPGVKSIGSNTFSEYVNLTHIALPSSLTSIGSGAFYRCSSLAQIVIPSSVASIYDKAFYECKSLTKISFGHPSSLFSIGKDAFSGCSSIIYLSIPPSVTKIGSGDFNGSSSLTQLLFGTSSSLIEIECNTFNGCTSLTQITIPSSVTKIGSNAFYICSSLAQVSFGSPSFLTEIDCYAFLGCFSLTQIKIPHSVTSIGRNAFAECPSLAQITIPSPLMRIKESAFPGKSNIVEMSNFIF